MAKKKPARKGRQRPAAVMEILSSMGLPASWPLSPHRATNRWYATIRSKRHYFGPIDDPDGALERYTRESPYLHRGQTPPPGDDDRVRLGYILDEWTKRQRDRLKLGDIRPGTLSEYLTVAEIVGEHFGRSTPVDMLGPSQWTDLHNAIRGATTSPAVVKRRVVIVRQIFKWANLNQKIAQPVAFGTEFVVPPKRNARDAMRSHGRQTMEPADILAVIEAAGEPLATMVLIAINTGSTQIEISEMRRRDIDVEAQALDSIRNKTGIRRIAPFWPETWARLLPYIEQASKPDDRLFMHPDGQPYVFFTQHDKPQRRDRITVPFKRLLKAQGVSLKQSSFGKLRATHRTASDQARDTNAARLIMGHAIGEGVEESYIRSIDMDRLRAVVDHVHRWLYEGGGDADKGQRPADTTSDPPTWRAHKAGRAGAATPYPTLTPKAGATAMEANANSTTSPAPRQLIELNSAGALIVTHTYIPVGGIVDTDSHDGAVLLGGSPSMAIVRNPDGSTSSVGWGELSPVVATHPDIEAKRSHFQGEPVGDIELALGGLEETLNGLQWSVADPDLAADYAALRAKVAANIISILSDTWPQIRTLADAK